MNAVKTEAMERERKGKRRDKRKKLKKIYIWLK